jgi:CRISPR-associated protein Cst2
MSIHIHANLLTHHGIASNNRGEGNGVTATLQKVCCDKEMYSTCSAEAIRAAVRATIPEEHRNRIETDDGGFCFRDKTFSKLYIDDILFGYMDAQAAKHDASDPEEANGKSGKNGKNGSKKGTCNNRRGLFEANRMVSLSPWKGDVSFNIGRKGGNLGSKNADHGNIFGSEIHATRYQWPYTITPEKIPHEFVALFIEFLKQTVHASHVAGNHSRYAFDYSAESVVVRATHSLDSRIMYCFDEDCGARKLVKQVEMGDIDAKELVLGGPFVESTDGQKLVSLGAFAGKMHGINAAMEEVARRVKTLCKWK